MYLLLSTSAGTNGFENVVQVPRTEFNPLAVTCFSHAVFQPMDGNIHETANWKSLEFRQRLVIIFTFLEFVNNDQCLSRAEWEAHGLHYTE